MQTQTFDLLINTNNNISNKIHKGQPPPPSSDLGITMSSSSTPIRNNDNNGNPSPSSSASSSNDTQKPQNDKSPPPAAAAPAVNTSQSTTPSRTNPRPARACTARAAAARLYFQQKQQQLYQQPPPPAPPKKKKEAPKREDAEEEEKDSPQQQQCAKIITPLVSSSIPDSQLPRWTLRSMSELASVLHFLHVFRPLLNIGIEFSAEELETALLNPNDTLGEIHMPLLKAIPPVTRISLARNTWITILCRKLRDWWYWVADGDIPIVAAQGAEVDAYNALDPGVRVMILKALCDIRVEQEDIRNYIDNSIKHGVHLSAFRKERIGGDSHGVSYWYEDDPVIGHRLYREIRKVEVKKVKTKGSQVLSNTTYQWEAVATNLDEFQDVSEKLFESKNRTEASVGKKLKNDMLPEIEKVHKKKEKLLKKQHREALLLDSYMSVDGLGPGRSLRDRKRVTYTFDDYDRSINEAIKITKQKQPSPEPSVKREVKSEAQENGTSSGPSQAPHHGSFSALSPNSTDFDEFDEDHKLEHLDRSNRRRQRPQRYSAKEYIEAVSDNEADFESDDEIVGEAVYDDEYLKNRKRRKLSSGSEGDDEYRGDEENAEDEEEEEEEEEDSETASEESDDPRRYRKLSGRTRRETKLRSVREIQSGLRRSNRSTRNRINYRQIEFSESENESAKPENSNASDEHSDFSENAENSGESRDFDGDNNVDKDIKVDQPIEVQPATVEEVQTQMPEKSSSPAQDELHGARKRRFLDLNELAPGSGFDESPNTIMKDDADDS